MDNNKLAYTVHEAAQIMGLSPRTIYELCYSGQIAHTRVKARGKKGMGKIIISRKALEEYLERSQTYGSWSNLDPNSTKKNLVRRIRAI